MSKHNIKLSEGFQCAPLAHEALGTNVEGCVRMSVGPMTNLVEIDSIIDALKETIG